MAFLRIILWLAVVLVVGALAYVLWGSTGGLSSRAAPFDLAAKPGPMSVLRLGALAGQGGRCRALLDRAGVEYVALPSRRTGPDCSLRDTVRWSGGGARATAYAPAAPTLSCPLAAALTQWEWSVVQPAAARIFGATVARIDHFGSYSCRRIYGGSRGNWSEHAAANAIDVAGFRLADGRRITVARDWTAGGREARFLREVRDGGCRLFGTTLSPDYNAAHRDHLHLDEAARGGWGFCR